MSLNFGFFPKRCPTFFRPLSRHLVSLPDTLLSNSTPPPDPVKGPPAPSSWSLEPPSLDHILASHLQLSYGLLKPSHGKVIVGISGGVDSAVSAHLLLKQGYTVEGLFINCWDIRDELGQCSADEDWSSASKVCSHLGIHLHKLNLVRQYWVKVFENFLSGYVNWETPNPDIDCNREIKFGAFLDHAINTLGAAGIATGHYAQLIPDLSLNSVQLARGVDPKKDQSYFLSAVNAKALSKALFPLGGLKKSTVKQIATSIGLHNADRQESFGICFVGKRPFTDFMSDYIDIEPAKVINIDTQEDLGEIKNGNIVTIGQSLPICRNQKKFYVVSKDKTKKIVYVVQDWNHPQLFFDELFIKDFIWINPPDYSLTVVAQIRHLAKPLECKSFTAFNGGVRIVLAIAVRAPSKGQVLALYYGDICLGGGPITHFSRTGC